MAATTVAQLAPCISCHAWNADFSLVAFCPNNNEVQIHKAPKEGQKGDWERVHVLKKHDQLVSGIHWAAKSNRLVTCSHDRNAYVWNLEEKGWVPTLVLLRLQRAALSVEWSPRENKFAVGSGAKTLLVCYYEEENNWWVSKVVKKKHTSSVTAIAWHPNNSLLATASTDGKCRVFNAHVKAVDQTGEAVGDTKFGDMLLQIEGSGAWLHSVRWSPSGEQLGFISHDSTIQFYDLALEEGGLKQQKVLLKALPFRTLIFLSDERAIAAGYDNNPALFARDTSGVWSFVKYIDEAKSTSSGGPKLTSQFSMGLERFKGQDKHGDQADSGGELTNKVPITVHENTITYMHTMASSASALIATTRFSTSGLDGRLVIWDLSSAILGMAGLNLSS